ncbi:type I secretion system permease/ATPase [Piscinibacter sp. HJYY11]|uniref:type I secretion system permease/ATPase n=1 Tax=Piscinibacter sp. HJYY11 TaxID=2801333 RepID=UPI00191DFBAF|nr:type I secretion system permease/ATPase [Piscinibacter sp. HJYY11]MBL0727351.1 type I secretion system permease/ATPase [Piscinibacter sp. HJYY11]
MSARQEPFIAPPAGSLHADDALAQAIVWLCKHHGRERSAESLLANTPVEGNLGPDQAVRIMREAGFNAGLIQKRISDIHSLLLPAVLLLKNGDCAILVARHAADKGADAYDVIMPGPESHACKATEAELVGEYTGFAFVASPKPQAAVNLGDEALLDPGAHWLWGTLRRFIPYYRSALLAAALSNVLMLASGLITAVVFDKVIPHQAFVTLWALATGGFIALGFDLIARQLRSSLIDRAGKKADMLIGSLLFRQTLGVRMEHRPESAGSYAHHLAQIETVRDFFAGATLSALSDLPFIVIFIAMTFVIGGPLGWVLVFAVPLILLVSFVIQSSLRRSMSAHMAHQADLQGLLVEAVEGLEDVKAAGAQGRFLRRYEDATAAGAETALRARSLGGLTNNIAAMSQQLVTLVMLIVGVYLIHAGVISGGAVIGAIMFAGRAIGPLNSVVGLATRYQGARAAMVALDQMMSLPLERTPGATYVANHEIKGRIALREVGFSYPPTAEDAAAPKVLKGVTLKFEPGERVAILGRIGSGKSTVLRLLAGLYQPTEGMVEVDGIDLRQIDPADFRVKVGFVSQEPRLFKGTLRENVLMGRVSVDATRLAEVARVTGLDRLIASHPQGWELPVGEMGGLLSGGQRQLVALARCLVTQPQILLMDEPTSSMDAQSETLFLRQLNEALGTRTVVMVTHRPAVLELAQRVVVVDGGKVVLDGPKAQVLAALSGAKPAATATPETTTSPNVHLHPSTQPVQRQASV